MIESYKIRGANHLNGNISLRPRCGWLQPDLMVEEQGIARHVGGKKTFRPRLANLVRQRQRG